MKPTNQRRNKIIHNGASYTTSRSRINWNAPDVKKDVKHPKTANGWVFYGFLWILWICIFLIAYFHHATYLSHSTVLKNAFLIPSGINFGIVLFWFAGRSLIFSYLTFTLYKLSEIIKLRKIKRFLKMEQDDQIFDNLGSYEDYKDYLKIKKSNSKIAFYVGFITFIILFIATLIAALV